MNDRPHPSGIARALFAIAIGVAASPVIAAVAHGGLRGASDGIASGDMAFVLAASRNAAHFAQTLGPYSRYGFAHPGPALFYVLAPVSHLGQSVVPFYAVAALLWLAASLGFVRAFGRGAEEPASSLALAAVVAGFANTLTQVHFLDFAVVHPWNPLVSTSATLAMVACSAALAERRAPAALPFAAAFVLAFQSHATFVPIACAIALASAKDLLALARSDERRARAWIGAALAVLVVAFVPVCVEALVHRGGNVAALWHAVRDGVDRPKPFLEASRIYYMLAGPTLAVLDAAGVRTDRFSTIPRDATFVVSALALWGMLRHRKSPDARLRALFRLTLAVVFGTLATLPFLRGHVNPHPFYPVAILGVMLHAAALVPLALDASAVRVAWLPWLGLSLFLAFHADRVTLARRAEFGTWWPPAFLVHATARVAGCVADRGPLSIRVEGKSGWIPAATAGLSALQHGRVPRLDPSQRLWFGEPFAYGDTLPAPGRPTLVVTTLPLHRRVTRDTRPFIQLAVKVHDSTSERDRAALDRCMRRMPGRR